MIESNQILQWYAAQRAEHQVIAYPRMFAEICDRNPTEALILSQLFFWSLPNSKTGKSKLKVFREGHYWLAKSNQEWADEVVVKPRSARTALSNLKKKGLVTTQTFKWKGVPTVHSRINESALEKEISKWQKRHSDLAGSSEPIGSNVKTMDLAESSSPYTETKKDSTQTTTTPQGGGGSSGGGSSVSSQRDSNAQRCAQVAVGVLETFNLKVAITDTLVKACKGKSTAAATLNAVAVLEHRDTGQSIKSPQGMLTRALQQNWAPSHSMFTGEGVTKGHGLSESGKRMYVQEYAIAAERLGYIDKLSFVEDEYFYRSDGQLYRTPYSILPLLPSGETTLQNLWSEIEFQKVA